MSDETDPESLRERVRELEETVDQLKQRRGPSRRDLLKVGSGGLLGAGLLASSQPVSAAPASADTSAGQVGVAGDSNDVVLDQLRDPGGDEILNVDDSGGINAQFGRPWYFDTLDVEELTTDAPSDGTLKSLISLPTSGSSIEDAYQLSAGVSTTETEIFEAGDYSPTLLGHFVIVTGAEDGDSSETFTDAVVYTFNGDATVLGSAENANPSNRTYTVPTNGDLALTMSANTYDIVASGISQRY